MTENTQPTDAEIDEFLDSPGNINWVLADKRERFRLFARAVLTRWGQPAQAAEPVAWAFKYDDGTWHDPSTTEHSSGMRPLFEAPHPVACEPLIRQMRNALALPCDRWNATQSRIVREAIAAADAWLEGN